MVTKNLVINYIPSVVFHVEMIIYLSHLKASFKETFIEVLSIDTCVYVYVFCRVYNIQLNVFLQIICKAR